MATINLSDVLFYMGGESGVSKVAGNDWDNGGTVSRVARYAFTAPAEGANEVNVTFYSSGLGSGDAIPLRFFIGTDPESHVNAGVDSEYHGELTMGEDGMTFTAEMEILLLPGTTYYLWVFPGSNTFGWYWWSRPDHVSYIDLSGAASVAYVPIDGEWWMCQMYVFDGTDWWLCLGYVHDGTEWQNGAVSCIHGIEIAGSAAAVLFGLAMAQNEIPLDLAMLGRANAVLRALAEPHGLAGVTMEADGGAFLMAYPEVKTPEDAQLYANSIAQSFAFGYTYGLVFTGGHATAELISAAFAHTADAIHTMGTAGEDAGASAAASPVHPLGILLPAAGGSRATSGPGTMTAMSMFMPTSGALGGSTCPETRSVNTLSFESASWAEIAEISEAGQAAEYFSIGDTKQITVEDTSVTLRIIGFDHDTLADGTGKAGMTIVMQTPPSPTMPVSDWSTVASTMRSKIKPLLPEALQAVIKPVLKPCDVSKLNTAASPVDMEFDVFPLSFDECGIRCYGSRKSSDSTWRNVVTQLGNIYQYFSDNYNATWLGPYGTFLSNSLGCWYRQWMRATSAQGLYSYKALNTSSKKYAQATANTESRTVLTAFCI